MVARVPISATQRAFFHRNGFLVLDKTPLLSKEKIESLHKAFERCFRGEFSTGLYPDEWHWREGISKPDAVREICNAWKADREIQDIVCSASIGELGGALYADWPSARVGQDDMIWKIPADGTDSDKKFSNAHVGYHVDGEYISCQFEEKCANQLETQRRDDAHGAKGILGNSVTVLIVT